MKIPFFVSCLLTLLFSALLGYGLHLLYQHLRNKKASNVILLIVSVALLFLFENLILLFFDADVKTLGLIKKSVGIEIFGASITILQIVIIAFSLLVLISLYIMMHRTKLGKKMRAVADNPELASIVGIDAKKIMAASFVIGSLLAGSAGILIGLEQNLSPSMGTNLMIKGFSGAVIGGIFSVPASVIGSYLVGIAENFGIWWLPSAWKDAITFSLLFLFLLFRPQGIFKRGERV